MANPLIGEDRHETGYTESTGGQGSSGLSRWVLRGTTTDATPTVLYINNDSTNGKLTIPSGESWTFKVMCTGAGASGTSAGFTVYGVIENVGGTTAIVGTNTTADAGEDDATDIAVEADDTNDALTVTVTGIAENINWTAEVVAIRTYNAA